MTTKRISLYEHDPKVVNQTIQQVQEASDKFGVLKTGTITNAATLDLNLKENIQCKIYKLVLYSIMPETDGQVPYLRFSDDNAASYEADAADYAWDFDGSSAGTAIDTGDASDSEIELSGAIGNASGEGCGFEITILNPAGSGTTRFHWIGHSIDGSGNFANIAGAGRTLVAGPSTHVRFLFASGAIVSGGYTFIGIG